MANQNRVTTGRPPGAQGPAAASLSAGARLPAPEAITRIMLRPLASSLPPGFFAFSTGSILLALLWEDSASQTVLPLGRRGRARTSLEGDFGHQIERAEREPGVRRQL